MLTCSARPGILGNWFDKDYDVHGPAGPTAFWKVSDDIVEEKKPVSNTFWGFLSQQAAANVDDGEEEGGATDEGIAGPAAEHAALGGLLDE